MENEANNPFPAYNGSGNGGNMTGGGGGENVFSQEYTGPAEAPAVGEDGSAGEVASSNSGETSSGVEGSATTVGGNDAASGDGIEGVESGEVDGDIADANDAPEITEVSQDDEPVIADDSSDVDTPAEDSAGAVDASSDVGGSETDAVVANEPIVIEESEGDASPIDTGDDGTGSGEQGEAISNTPDEAPEDTSDAVVDDPAEVSDAAPVDASPSEEVIPVPEVTPGGEEQPGLDLDLGGVGDISEGIAPSLDNITGDGLGINIIEVIVEIVVQAPVVIETVTRFFGFGRWF